MSETNAQTVVCNGLLAVVVCLVGCACRTSSALGVWSCSPPKLADVPHFLSSFDDETMKMKANRDGNHH